MVSWWLELIIWILRASLVSGPFLSFPAIPVSPWGIYMLPINFLFQRLARDNLCCLWPYNPTWYKEEPGRSKRFKTLGKGQERVEFKDNGWKSYFGAEVGSLSQRITTSGRGENRAVDKSVWKQNIWENLHIKAQVGSLDLSKENTTQSLALSADGGKEVGH